MSEHKTEDQLAEKLAQAAAQVEIGARYEHYKGLGYAVIGLALTEETLDVCVIYRAEYGNQLTYTRPLTSWLQTVEIDGETHPRFKKSQSQPSLGK